MTVLVFSDITPAILLHHKRPGQASGKGKAVLAEGAWPSNLMFFTQLFLCLGFPWFLCLVGKLQAQAPDLVWSQVLGRDPYWQIPPAAAITSCLRILLTKVQERERGAPSALR